VPRIASIILAAGLSSRCPANKLLQLFRGKPLVRHAVEAASASMAAPLIVVTGHQAPEVLAALDGLALQEAHNAAFASGLSSSLVCGLKMVPQDCDGALVLLGDMPLVTPTLIDQVIAAFEPESRREICCPVRGGRRGHPVLWSRRFFPELMTLTGDQGGKPVMASHRDVLYELEISGDAAFRDFDTDQDFASR